MNGFATTLHDKFLKTNDRLLLQIQFSWFTETNDIKQHNTNSW